MGMGKSVSSPHSDDALTREQAEQEELCSLYSRLYDNDRPEEEEVRSYLEQRDTQHPLVVVGGPCTGKTVLLAHCAQQVDGAVTQDRQNLIEVIGRRNDLLLL